MKAAPPLSKQQGTVLVLTALCLFVLMGMAGLAIDVGHTMVNKTIEQNATDAMAMSAAIRLNKKNDPATNIDELDAEAEGKATYALFKNSNSKGNGEIQGWSDSNFNFTFAKVTDLSTSLSTAWQSAGAVDAGGTPTTVDTNFVRVASNARGVNTWFASVVGFPQLAVSASSVAGTTPITPCDVAPIMMCAEVNPTTGAVLDDDCTNDSNPNATIAGEDKDCYGYEINALYCMKQQMGAWDNDPLCPDPPTGNYGAGNFGFLDYDPPGLNPSLKYCAAGDPDCALNCRFATDPDTGLPIVPTKTGQDFGQAQQGFNTRFNLYGGGLDPEDYPPDLVIGSGTNGDVTKVQRIGAETELTDIYSIYKAAATDITTNVSLGQKGRRILPIPFIDCRTSIDGKTDVKIKGFGCFMMAREYGNSSQPYVYDNIEPSKKFLYGVFVGNDVCSGVGKANSVHDFGIDKVILYKDPFGGHS
jgi:Flp pilus assembly protein TadG